MPVPYPVPGPGPYAGALWALPAAAAVTLAGATYYAVGNAYYQPVIQDGTTVYVQVNPPQSGDDDGFGDDGIDCNRATAGPNRRNGGRMKRFCLAWLVLALLCAALGGCVPLKPASPSMFYGNCITAGADPCDSDMSICKVFEDVITQNGPRPGPAAPSNRLQSAELPVSRPGLVATCTGGGQRLVRAGVSAPVSQEQIADASALGRGAPVGGNAGRRAEL